MSAPSFERLYEGADWDFSTIQRIHDACEEIARTELGLDPYPNQIEVITAEQMLDAYASIGMPLFYKHWSFGKHFTQHEALYRRGMRGLAYEIVINSSPCIAYLMEENVPTQLIGDAATAGARLVAFPEAFARLEAVLKSGEPLLLRGRVNVEEGSVRVAVQEAKSLDQVSPGAPGSAQIRVRVELGAMDEYTLDRLKELFARSPGSCPISFDLQDPDGSVATLRSNQRVRLDDKLVDAVRQMCGADAVEGIR